MYTFLSCVCSWITTIHLNVLLLITYTPPPFIENVWPTTPNLPYWFYCGPFGNITSRVGAVQSAHSWLESLNASASVQQYDAYWHFKVWRHFRITGWTVKARWSNRLLFQLTRYSVILSTSRLQGNSVHRYYEITLVKK